MSLINFIPASLRALPRDGIVLFLTRFLRLFAYGALSVVLGFYLVSLGLTEAQVGLLLTLTLAGDIGISLLLTTRADHLGRRRTLFVGALLMAAAGGDCPRLAQPPALLQSCSACASRRM